MTILCRHNSEGHVRRMPAQTQTAAPAAQELVQRYEPAHDSIQVMTLHVSKGLEFLVVVALVGAGRMPAEGEDERVGALLFCVGATWATRRLVIGASGSGKFAARL